VLFRSDFRENSAKIVEQLTKSLTEKLTEWDRIEIEVTTKTRAIKRGYPLTERDREEEDAQMYGQATITFSLYAK
jgi:hypothetical protein